MARRGFVKQLSDLSIDEISTVDRGANQHSLIAIAKRLQAATADDFWPEEVTKDQIRWQGTHRYYWSFGSSNSLWNWSNCCWCL
jgi:hypothetical protein